MAEHDDLKAMKNIGPVTRGWLHEAGIHTVETVRALGSVEVWRRIRALHPDRVSLNALWGLEALLLDIPVSALTAETKAELKKQVEDLL